MNSSGSPYSACFRETPISIISRLLFHGSRQVIRLRGVKYSLPPKKTVRSIG